MRRFRIEWLSVKDIKDSPEEVCTLCTKYYGNIYRYTFGSMKYHNAIQL